MSLFRGAMFATSSTELGGGTTPEGDPYHTKAIPPGPAGYRANGGEWGKKQKKILAPVG